MYKTVFILGAGASADAGLPVMANFLDRARDFYSSNSLQENEKKSFEEVFKAIHELKGASFYSNLDLNNIEAVYSAFDMGKLLGQLGSISPERIQSLNSSIQNLIGITIDLSTTLIHHSGQNTTIKGPYHAYVQFIQSLWKNNTDNLPSIITFNYDVALEYALYFESEPFDYCLEKETPHGAIHLLKLHGSVNWGLDDENDKIQSWDMGGILGKKRSLEVFRTPKQSSLIVSKYLHDQNRSPIANLPGPVLVPPTWSKGEHHAKIARVWQKAAKALSEAEAIYVIGYSLPETDMFFRFLFALATHSESSIRRFWVFDPSESVKDRFLSMLGPGLRDEPRFHFEQCKFGTAINYLRKNFNNPS